MSLVVCSNKIPDARQYDEDARHMSPNSFVNNLKQTMQIPKNSEIAVQSVKLTKTGEIELDQGNRFYSWFGRPLNISGTSTLPKTLDDTTNWPIITGPKLISGAVGSQYVNVSEFAARMSSGMQNGMPHPDIFGDGNGSDAKIECNILRSGAATTGLGFEGFQLKYLYNVAPTTNIFPTTSDYSFLSIPNGMTLTDGGVAGTTFTCSIAGHDTIAWGRDKPLSHMGGRCVFDLSGQMTDFAGADYTYGQSFQVGLSRYCFGHDGSGRYNGAPSYFDVNGQGTTFAENFYDYAISCELTVDGYVLRLLQPMHVEGQSGFGEIGMEEVEYFNGGGDFPNSIWNGATQGGRYDMTTNASNIQKVEFVVDNEQIHVYLVAVVVPPATEGVRWILASYANKAALGANRNNYPIPTRQTNWNMYPKVMMTSVGSSVILEEWQGRNTTFEGITYKGGDGFADWFNRMEIEGMTTGTTMIVDGGNGTRKMMTYTDLTYEYDQQGYTTDVLTGTQQVVILKPDDTNYTETHGANMSNILGFPFLGVLDWNSGLADTSRGIKYNSASIPKILNDNSMFIRLNNFTNRTVNAGTGRPSKILYHIPRFDTSGRDIGYGLYFEPNERVYIKLHNSEVLTINEFALDICQDDEVLAGDITGETIICLHIREVE